MQIFTTGNPFALNVVSGSSDKDLAREGDYTPKAERYARATDELRGEGLTHDVFDHVAAGITIERQG